jgi:NAD(P)-dependent dehydrogenase (short-subunit alcohol dehydrogenase family)
MTEPAGRIAVVTGGGSGIGRGLVHALAAEGATVAIADIIGENAERVAAEVRDAGGTAMALACDVCDRAAVAQLKADVNAALGTVSLLVANAGASWFDRLTDMSDADVDWIYEVNLRGVTTCLQTFLPDMIAAGDGHVVATASTAGLFPDWIPYHAPYSAAKAGIIAMMVALRPELTEAGVGCSVYCPGGVIGNLRKNNMRYRPTRFGGPTDEPMKGNEAWREKNKDKLIFITPEEAAPFVLRGIRDNLAVIIDHADQREIFLEHYVDHVLAGYDAAAAVENAKQ